MAKNLSSRFAAESHGNRRERLLAEAVAQPLLTDFVHLRPYYRPRGRTKIEFCDVIVEDGVRGAIVQVKSQDREKAAPGRDVRVWAVSACRNAADQVQRCFHDIDRVTVLARDIFGYEIEVPTGSIEFRHGIALIDCDRVRVALPDALPHRLQGSRHCHYFSARDFQTVSFDLLTTGDLLNYLDFRAELPLWARPDLGNETDLYAWYLTRKGRPAILTRDDFQGKWHWLTVEHADEYRERQMADIEARAFTEMILNGMKIRRPDRIANVEAYRGFNHHEHKQMYHRLVREINKVPRVPRRLLFQKLREVALRADSHSSGMGYEIVQDGKRRFVLLSSPSTRDDRIQRLEIVSLAVLNATDVELLIGIATPSMAMTTADSENFYFDIMLYESDQRTSDPEMIALYHQLFKDPQHIRITDFPSD